jgi:hypothetical protein
MFIVHGIQTFILSHCNNSTQICMDTLQPPERAHNTENVLQQCNKILECGINFIALNSHCFCTDLSKLSFKTVEYAVERKQRCIAREPKCTIQIECGLLSRYGTPPHQLLMHVSASHFWLSAGEVCVRYSTKASTRNLEPSMVAVRLLLDPTHETFLQQSHSSLESAQCVPAGLGPQSIHAAVLTVTCRFSPEKPFCRVADAPLLSRRIFQSVYVGMVEHRGMKLRFAEIGCCHRERKSPIFREPSKVVTTTLLDSALCIIPLASNHTLLF